MCMNCAKKEACDFDGKVNARMPTGWRCVPCQAEYDQQRHHNDSPSINDLNWLCREIYNAAKVYGLIDSAVDALPNVSSDSEDEESNSSDSGIDFKSESSSDEADESDGERPSGKSKRAIGSLKRQLRERRRGFGKLIGHKVRTTKFRRQKPTTIRQLGAHTMLEMKDYSAKLEARKSAQGTSENLGPKLSNHGSIVVIRNPSSEIRSAFSSVDWSTYPAAEEDCCLQANLFSVSDDSKQSAYHMGSTMEVTYKQVKQAFPWIRESITLSDQCGDYHSTQSLIFCHEIGRLTGIRIVSCVRY